MKRAVGLLTVLSLITVLYSPAAASQDAPYIAETAVLQSAEMPLYPLLARQARVEGTVRLAVTTDGTAVIKISASGAHKLLLNAAEQNVKTWHFYRHKPQTFTVTFVYKLEEPEVYEYVNPTVQLDLPSRVEIRTKLPQPQP